MIWFPEAEKIKRRLKKRGIKFKGLKVASLQHRYSDQNKTLYRIYFFNKKDPRYSKYEYECVRKHTPGDVNDVISAFALDIDTLQ